VLLLFIQDPGGEADGSKFEGISLLYPLKIMKISRIVYNDQLILVCFMSGKLSVERRGGGGGGGGRRALKKTLHRMDENRMKTLDEGDNNSRHSHPYTNPIILSNY